MLVAFSAVQRFPCCRAAIHSRRGTSRMLSAERGRQLKQGEKMVEFFDQA
jgi:hypothetical protein